MIKIFKQQKVFIWVFAIWVVLSTILLLINDNVFWQIQVNKWHSPLLDYFFRYFTWFGDGLLIIILSVLLVFVRFRFAIVSLLSYLISGLFAQLLKRFVFDDVYRPAHVFKDLDVELHQVLDVGLKTKHSFPSGHTTSGFALFFTLGLFLAVKRPALQLVLFFAAFLVGFSRIYLNLHFLNDVIMGSILGFLTTLFIYLWVIQWRANWLDKNLMEIFKR
jgi:membrane-associated phospholipid phosphatase